MRQIVFDTETTGIRVEDGNRVIEIGAVELIDRQPSGEQFHVYLNPDRESEEGALQVHGLTSAFLADKPRFAEVAEDFLKWVGNAALIAHNAPFDVGFIDHELRRLDPDHPGLAAQCEIIDTAQIARRRYPGQRASLDALVERLNIDRQDTRARREGTLHHGALLDAEILAMVYLRLTGGQTGLFQTGSEALSEQPASIRRLAADRPPLRVQRASPEEVSAHEARLDAMAAAGAALWRA